MSMPRVEGIGAVGPGCVPDPRSGSGVRPTQRQFGHCHVGTLAQRTRGILGMPRQRVTAMSKPIRGPPRNERVTTVDSAAIASETAQ